MSKCALCLFKTSDEAELNNLNWYICQNSKLTIWHRPKTSQIPILKEKFGLSTLVTLQCEREHLQDLSSICKKTGVFWLNIPLEGANLPYLKRKETKKLIRNGISEVLKILEKDNERILIHCAAGVHRTGVFGYSLFRMMGNVGNSFF